MPLEINTQQFLDFDNENRARICQMILKKQIKYTRRIKSGPVWHHSATDSKDRK